MALPVGIADGSPQAGQLIGGRYREDHCLDAAARIEERLGVITPIGPRKTPSPVSDQADVSVASYLIHYALRENGR